MESWQPFPDTVPALRAAKEAGLRLWIISNTDREIMEHSLRHLEIEFDGVTVAEDCRAYKPADAPIRARPARHRRRRREEILHVAFGFKYDLGAAQHGMPTAWVNRHGEPTPGPDGPSGMCGVGPARGGPNSTESATRGVVGAGSSVFSALTIATTRAGPALAAHHLEREAGHLEAGRRQPPRFDEALDLRVGEVPLVGRPEDPRLLAARVPPPPGCGAARPSPRRRCPSPARRARTASGWPPPSRPGRAPCSSGCP